MRLQGGVRFGDVSTNLAHCGDKVGRRIGARLSYILLVLMLLLRVVVDGAQAGRCEVAPGALELVAIGLRSVLRPVVALQVGGIWSRVGALPA